jgi:hypothetical protein
MPIIVYIFISISLDHLLFLGHGYSFVSGEPFGGQGRKILRYI